MDNDNTGRILFISHILSRTGAPIVLFDLVRACAQKGYLVEVISMEEGELLEDYESAGISVSIVSSFLDDAGLWQKRFMQYDAVVVNTLVCIEAIYILNTTAVPVLWWIHEHEYWFSHYQPIFPKSDELHSNIHVYGVSPITIEYIDKYTGYKAGLLPFGIKDVREEVRDCEPGEMNEKVIFLLPATYSHVKGQDILCGVIEKLPMEVRQSCEFILCGAINDGEKEYYETVKEYEKRLKELEVLGSLSHEKTYEYMKRADYVLVPSRLEPFSVTAVEAMMLERIPLVSSVCGVAHWIDDGKNGFIFEAESIDALERAIINAVRLKLESKSEYETISHNARENFEKVFDMDSFSERFLKELKLCMRNNAYEDVVKNEIRGEHFDTLVVITPGDCRRLLHLYPRLVDSNSYGRICFVGTKEVGDIVHADAVIGDRVGAIEEDSLIPFSEVHACMTKRMESILLGIELPRGVTGWYYQQFLKMQYALVCPDKYYMVWDGDTIPCKEIIMFQPESGKPYLDLKHEHHPEYFETMSVILPGFHKVIERSFISEHMLFRVDIMKNLIRDIEANDSIPGKRFWEKIINAIPPEKIQSSSFSEFETYGTYVALKYMDVYKLRDWHSFRQGGTFFDMDTICDRDFEWLSKDFFSISFEKGHKVREDNKGLFDNPYYQEKLSAKQMLQAAQMEYKEGYKEVWMDDPENAHGANESSGTYTTSRDLVPDSNIRYLSSNTYIIYEQMGDGIKDVNRKQAFLCYENAEFLCPDKKEKERLKAKKDEIGAYGSIGVNRVGIVILSYNNTYLLQNCIESIYSNCNPDSFLLVIFDNGSEQETRDWLTSWGESHDEALVILNEENLGFSGGNNAACMYLPEGYDVFYLNNDTRMPANALFWLRMGLYEAEDIGGTGAVQNYAITDQLEDVSFSVPEQYMEYGAGINIPMENPYEEKSKLCGFAMMIKRSLYDRTGGFDEEFSPGYLEDDDLSLRIRSLGFRLLACHNAFVYHAGSQSFKNRDDINDLFEEHRKLIVKKWGFESSIYAAMSPNELQFAKDLAKKGYDGNSEFSFVHIGCGCGNMLGYIHYLYPRAKVYGVEENSYARRFAISCVSIFATEEELPVPLGKIEIVAQNLG